MPGQEQALEMKKEGNRNQIRYVKSKNFETGNVDTHIFAVVPGVRQYVGIGDKCFLQNLNFVCEQPAVLLRLNPKTQE